MPRPPTDTRLPQSATPGVVWNAKAGKWRGTVQDKLKRTASGGKKCEYTTYYADKAECVAALEALRAKVEDEYWAEMTRRADAEPTTHGLALGPYHAADADVGVAYWRPNYLKNHAPFRCVRKGAGKQGVQWAQACKHASGCASIAHQAVEGGKCEFCASHGGHCPHGHAWTTCRVCNPKVTSNAQNCSSCGQVIGIKRMMHTGGLGICVHCETRKNAEAVANGTSTATLLKGKSWEDFCLDTVIPLIRDTDGQPFPYEMRDDVSNMLGSNKRARKNECDTVHQRRPDLLYLVRHPDTTRIVAALLVEIDEHSHGDRDPACEAGKIDETFQSLVHLAQTEGAARGAAARAHVDMPYVLFYKLNPNACDAPGGQIKLQTRLKTLARRARRFLRTPADDFIRKSRKGEANVPHVECLYYHSKEGARNLAHFDAHAAGAWDWRGNRC